DAFRHALLAPNPHNRQPWLIRLVGADEAVISCDLDKRLPMTDPNDRQITIGFGCFVELARLAVLERGHGMDVTPFPEGAPTGRLDARPVAHLRFRKDAAARPDPLFKAVFDRRSTKQPFDMVRLPTDDVLASLIEAAGGPAVAAATIESRKVARLRSIIWDAWQIEGRTVRTWKETVDLMRIGAREIDANPDGVSIKGPLFEALQATGQIDRAQLADSASSAFKTGEARYRTMFAATPGFMWIASEADDKVDALAAGRAYLRANLAATLRGLAMQPISQALQEFPEMREQYAKIHAETAVGKLQMLMRIGYGPKVDETPRWPLEKVLRT
ncbi:MAG: Acg family FMN-binding oxidoreductase, partial [Beijerinckiaceae bacterium]